MILPDPVLANAIEMANGMSVFDAKMTPKWSQEVKESPKDRRLGTVAEFALRWVFGMPQLTPPFDYSKLFDGRHNADVGDNVEIRATNWYSGKLLVRQKHDDVAPRINRDYCLVIVDKDWSFRIPGWLSMREIIPIWHTFRTKGRPDAKAVHQNQLRPLSQLVIHDGEIQYRFLSRSTERVQGGRQVRLF